MSHKRADTKWVQFRLDTEQHGQLKALVANMGCDLSGYCRQAVLQADVTQLIREIHAKLCGAPEPGMSQAASDAAQILVTLGAEAKHAKRAVLDFVAQEPQANVGQIVRELTRNGD